LLFEKKKMSGKRCQGQLTQGQLTQVTQIKTGATTLASNASYYPNGALAQFTYGNGIVHTMTQNARQLPSHSVDGSVLDLSTVFDENGNVAAIRKRCQGQLTRGPQEAATATRPRKLPLIANT